MKSFLKIDAILYLSVLLLLITPLFTFSTAHALVRCKTTTVGNVAEPPVLPPDCNAVGPNGISYPPNLECKPDGYCRMPDSPSGAYTVYSKEACRWGHKELIGVLHTVAERWKQKYAGGKLWIGDLNAVGHSSHNIGRAVDMYATTNGQDRAAQMGGNYNQAATIELGQMFMDTNIILHIWYNDQAVSNAVIQYARDGSKSPPLFNGQYNSEDRPGMRYQPDHEDHFHVDVQLPQELAFWEPGCR